MTPLRAAWTRARLGSPLRARRQLDRNPRPLAPRRQRHPGYCHVMKKTITTEKLQTLRKSAEGFLLIDVVAKEGFDKDHIPGARNVPLASADFVRTVALKASGSKTRKVVLYCDNDKCDASSKAVQMLVDDGFTNVIEYEGGLSSWNESKKARRAKAAEVRS